ncbi:MAG: glycoside hydrolase family 95 protein, partial [Clostridia bacterium]|nr:glycoside hydrolase family 95 protein [Clostridia bacterium]
MNHLLWYNKVSQDWMDALPLGNGKVAAMVYGNPDVEKIEINEESLWSGSKIKEKNTATKETLDELRMLLFAERNEEATALANDTFLANPKRLRFYESFGEITIEYDDKRPYYDYRKELDLSEGLVNVTYTKYHTTYKSESFVSEKHNVFVYKMQTDDKSPFSCSVTLSREQDAYTSTLDDKTLLLKGRLTYNATEQHGEGGEGMSFAAKLCVVTDGKCKAEKKKIHIENATSFVIYGAFATNYNIEKFDIDEEIDYEAIVDKSICSVLDDGYDSIKKEHIKSHKEMYDRVSLSINDSEKNHMPTDVRLNVIKSGEWDDSFFVLYFNFGRYLLMCSSGKNATLPANLQGKWCHGYTPIWGSDYHTNINLQMNYWPALPLNMAETMKPYTDFVSRLSQCGKSTAKELYGANGWVVHHNTD